MKVLIEIEVDTEENTLRIEGEHSVMFYTVWNNMMAKAKQEGRDEVLCKQDATIKGDYNEP